MPGVSVGGLSGRRTSSASFPYQCATEGTPREKTDRSGPADRSPHERAPSRDGPRLSPVARLGFRRAAQHNASRWPDERRTTQVRKRLELPSVQRSLRESGTFTWISVILNLFQDPC